MSINSGQPSARTYIEKLFRANVDRGQIERRVLLHQNNLDWDVPAPHPFAFEGIKREADRIRLLVNHHLDRLQSPNYLRQDEVGVGVDPFTSSSEDEYLWFSKTGDNVSHVQKIFSPQLLRVQPFAQTWAGVERMAHDIAWKLIDRETHLSRVDLEDLVQAGRIAAWQCVQTYDGTTAKYSTYAHQAMFNAMKDHSVLVKPSTDLDWFQQKGQTDDFSDSLCDFLTVISSLQKMKDGHLLAASALGLHDAEMQEKNVRVRRFRARDKLAAMLDWSPS